MLTNTGEWHPSYVRACMQCSILSHERADHCMHECTKLILGTLCTVRDGWTVGPVELSGTVWPVATPFA